MKKIKKEWIGKLGSSVYKIEYDEASIYPQGIELNLKLMDSSLWLDGYNKDHIKKGKDELAKFISHLTSVWDYMNNFEWSEEKEREYLEEIKEVRKPRKPKEKKESGV